MPSMRINKKLNERAEVKKTNPSEYTLGVGHGPESISLNKASPPLKCMKSTGEAESGADVAP